MVLRRITTGTITCTATTYKSKLSDILSTTNEGPFIGKIEKIAINVSASSDFKIYALQGDGTSAEEYVLGASGAAVTVAADKVFYPMVIDQKASDGTNLATYKSPIVYGDLYLDVSAVANADTFEVVFFISDR